MKVSVLKSAVCAAALMVVAAPAAMAQEEASSPFSFSGSLTLTSDYVFRGISQTQNDPALQGSFDVSHESGLYAGVWASNVDFNDATDTNLEVDFYGGFANSIEAFSYDIGVLYYAYPDTSGVDYDYVEFLLGLGYDFEVLSISGAVYYSPDFFAETGDAYYVTAGVAVPVLDWLTLDANVGYQDIDDNVTFGADDYTDWNVGATVSVEGFDFGVRYTDNDAEVPGGGDLANDIADSKVVFSVSRAL
ncbi:MAG: hypothetical protein GC199_11155 [Alphaproteobacteria bacterium]|nr:hypothetical protein [Alphaproteobacteria bacterium]